MSDSNTVFQNISDFNKEIVPGDLVEVRQLKSSSGRSKSQTGTLIGLGLRRIGDLVQLQCTPSNIGMMKTVFHLVQIQRRSK